MTSSQRCRVGDAASKDRDPEITDENANSTEPLGATRKSQRLRKERKEREKELKRQVKKMEKDCKKLQKTLGKWMDETRTDITTRKKKRRKRDSANDDQTFENKKLKLDANEETSKPKYRWDDAHIHKFFHPSQSLDVTSHDIEMDRFDIKLICPLGKMRIRHPVRSSECDHIQPFDRDNFVKLERVAIGRNKKSFCPICSREISSQQLVEDSFFVEVLLRSVEADEVVVYADGFWQPMPKQPVDVAVLGDDCTGDEDLEVTDVVRHRPNKSVIDLTDDTVVEDDDDDIIPI